ncbi:hypothetical protein L1887_35812 [Cichorium endivia]|nr:hypothetical protein L1887_35812 [Cichorium endivia]
MHCYGSGQEDRASGGSRHVCKEEGVLQESRDGLEMREVRGNSDLRKLLIGTKNRSIIAIEDIDACGVGLQNWETENDSPKSNDDDDKISLSGLLNFVDGLWSSCGDERIIVFTTNHKERLDPALFKAA